MARVILRGKMLSRRRLISHHLSALRARSWTSIVIVPKMAFATVAVRRRRSGQRFV